LLQIRSHDIICCIARRGGGTPPTLAHLFCLQIPEGKFCPIRHFLPTFLKLFYYHSPRGTFQMLGIICQTWHILPNFLFHFLCFSLFFSIFLYIFIYFPLSRVTIIIIIIYYIIINNISYNHFITNKYFRKYFLFIIIVIFFLTI